MAEQWHDDREEILAGQEESWQDKRNHGRAGARWQSRETDRTGEITAEQGHDDKAETDRTGGITAEQEDNES